MVKMKSFWAVFVEKGNLTMSIDEVIKRAVDGFKRGVPIEFDLKLINRDSQVLTDWAYETDSFFDDSDLMFLLTEDEIFYCDLHDEEEIYDYLDVEELSLQEDQSILDFIARRADEVIERDEFGSLQLKAFEGVTLSSICRIMGQGGPHFSDLDVFESKAECVESFINSGWIIWGGDPERPFSNSDSQLVSMYKRNIYQKFSGIS